MMKRRLLNFAVGLSLALCLATMWMWLRSHRVPDQFSRGGSGWYVLINSDHGAIAFVAVDESPALDIGDYSWRWHTVRGGGSFGGGFDATVGSSVSRYVVKGSNVRQRAWWVSHWIIAAGAAIAPAWWLAGLWKRRWRVRAERGLCSVCAYDMRATPLRCPECGAVPG